nr:hypothetical protein [Thiomonas delicata]
MTGSHGALTRAGWTDFTFAFHDGDEIGPRMLARGAQHTGLTPDFFTFPESTVQGRFRPSRATSARGQCHVAAAVDPRQAGICCAVLQKKSVFDVA